LEVTLTSSTPSSPSIKKYEAEIEKLKNWITFILINKGIFFTSVIVLFFVLYVFLKRYVRKRTKNQSNIENQTNNNKNNNQNNNQNENNNNYNDFNLLEDAQEFHGIVNTVLNLGQ